MEIERFWTWSLTVLLGLALTLATGCGQSDKSLDFAEDEFRVHRNDMAEINRAFLAQESIDAITRLDLTNDMLSGGLTSSSKLSYSIAASRSSDNIRIPISDEVEEEIFWSQPIDSIVGYSGETLGVFLSRNDIDPTVFVGFREFLRENGHYGLLKSCEGSCVELRLSEHAGVLFVEDSTSPKQLRQYVELRQIADHWYAFRAQV